MAVNVDEVLDELDTEDYAAFSKVRDSAPSGETEDDEKPPAAGDKKPASEPADAEEDEAGQIAEESDPEEEEQQEEEEQEEDQDKDKSEGPGSNGKSKDNRLARRMRELTGKIKTLESQLAEKDQPSEDAEEAEEEVVSSPETGADKAETLVRPMLKDFEDTDTESAWDQYEKAMEAYHDAKYDQRLERKLAEQKAKLDLEHATATADADWSKAAARFPDYNEVVLNDKVQISAAMEKAMRMDPESGTALAYYLGQHPEESLRIAKLTLATNAKEWEVALSRAGMELGIIRVKLTAPGAKKDPAKADDKPKPTAAPPLTKKVTSASKPPTVIRGGTAPPQTDVMDEDGASDYKKWNRAREAQLKRK